MTEPSSGSTTPPGKTASFELESSAESDAVLFGALLSVAGRSARTSTLLPLVDAPAIGQPPVA
ncbi:hypothetical protein [Leifsonia sp. Root112D2]|uniref:hypothetical protein n=1 Tax=Leifsonia sp. Root112D2 TaxID=1736426 RepID=UPI0012F7194E|nr:hypothetical protein [Leifsonia sp. Root112D2]